MITDDEISAVLVQTLPEGARLTSVMDCCHSGTGQGKSRSIIRNINDVIMLPLYSFRSRSTVYVD